MREQLGREAEILSETAERLADVALDLLASGVKGDSEAVRLERDIQRARRSVVKACEILRSLGGQPDD